MIQRLALLIFAVVFLLLAASCGNGSNSDQGKNCGDGTYVVGEILVGFNEGVSEDQANNLIESYGLTAKDFKQIITLLALVVVPDCTEEQWIVTFEQEDIVSHAELNYIVRTQEEQEPAGAFLL